MLPIPKHLRDIFVLEGENNDEFQASGIIRCDCGSGNFRIKFFADTSEGFLRVCEYEDDYALIIKADCNGCGKGYFIHDASRNGWDGFVCGGGVSVPNEELASWLCPKCGGDNQGMSVTIRSEGRQDFIEEAGIADGDDTFDADDWAEAYSSISIGLKCPCGYKDNNWIDHETM